MLHPDYLIDNLNTLHEIFSDMHTSVLAAIARHLADTFAATGGLGIMPSTVTQIGHAANAGVFREEVERHVADALGASIGEVRSLFDDAAVKSMSYDNEVYEEAGLKPIDIAQSPQMLKTLDAGVSRATGSIERLTGAFTAAADEKMEELVKGIRRKENLAFVKTASGAFSYTAAVNDAVDSLAREGIGIYSFASKRNISVEAAVLRSVRTSIAQTCGEMTRQGMAEQGCAHVETSAHMGARNKDVPGRPWAHHGNWQGRVFSYPQAGVDEGDGNMGLHSMPSGGIMNTRGGSVSSPSASGAIPVSDFRRRDRHAEMYYNSVRKMTSDVASISANTGFNIDEISIIKNHIFFNKYDLGGSEPESFAPEYHMALSWQRLIDGKNIEDMDIILLKHELREHELMIVQGMNYSDAHRLAENEYNYKLLADLKDELL